MYCGESIGGFTALADGDDHILLVNQGIAVTKFTGILHLDRQAGNILEQVLSDQSRVPRGSASDNDDPPCLQQPGHNIVQSAQMQVLQPGPYPSPESILYGARLLKDLLQHEMFKAVFFNGPYIKTQFLDIGNQCVIADGLQHKFIFTDNGNIVIIQVNDAFGILYNRGRIGCKKILIFPYAYHQRAPFPRGNEFIGFFTAHDDKPVSTYYFCQCEPDSNFS